MEKFNFKTLIKTILLTSTVLVLSACSGLKSENFRKQKFTSLKEIEAESINTLQVDPINTDNGIISAKFLDNQDTSVDDTVVCDTILLKSGAIIDCTILAIDSDNITYSECPPTENVFLIPTEKVNRYNKLTKITLDSKTKNDTKSEQIDAIDTGSIDEEYAAHIKQAKKLFLISLIFLAPFSFGIFLALNGVELLAIILVAASLVFGYPILGNAVKNMRIAKLLKPENFSYSNINLLYTIMILGMMLFGSVPFLIPFFIAWLIVSKLAAKEADRIEKANGK